MSQSNPWKSRRFMEKLGPVKPSPLKLNIVALIFLILIQETKFCLAHPDFQHSTQYCINPFLLNKSGNFIIIKLVDCNTRVSFKFIAFTNKSRMQIYRN